MKMRSLRRFNKVFQSSHLLSVWIGLLLKLVMWRAFQEHTDGVIRNGKNIYK